MQKHAVGADSRKNQHMPFFSQSSKLTELPFVYIYWIVPINFSYLFVSLLAKIFCARIHASSDESFNL